MPLGRDQDMSSIGTVPAFGHYDPPRLTERRAQCRLQAMRHGGVDRIEREKSTTFADDGSHAHDTHLAHLAEVKIDEQLGVIRVIRVVAAGRMMSR